MRSAATFINLLLTIVTHGIYCYESPDGKPLAIMFKVIVLFINIDVNNANQNQFLSIINHGEPPSAKIND